MVILDYILLVLVLLLGLWGLRKGFLQSLGSIFGLIIAVVVASRFYPIIANWFGGSNVSNIIAFIVITSLTVKVVSLLFWVFGKIFRIVTVLPIISQFDRLLGLILGLVQGVLATAAVLTFLIKFPFNLWIVEQMSSSLITRVLLDIGNVFIPLFPEAIKKLKSFM